MGRKLISLVLVVAAAAVIAAACWPRAIADRVSSEESASAAMLKSALLPAQVQFQNGGYCDRDGNGIGTYAPPDRQPSGAARLGPRAGESMTAFGERIAPQDLFGAALIGSPRPVDAYMSGGRK